MKRGAETEKKMRQDNEKDNDKTKSLETLRSLHGVKKLQYIWDYYKLPLFITGVVLYAVIYAAYRHLTYKDTSLYAALVNVNAGESLTEQLENGFLDAAGIDASSNKLQLYSGLYLTDDADSPHFEYTYASRVKILAAIDGEMLDAILLDKEAFDAFSQNGYLCRIDELLSEEYPDFYSDIAPFIENNIFIKEDNSSDVLLDSSIPYSAVTEEYPMGADLSQAKLIRQAGFDEPVYFGIIANSPRKDMAVRYLEYLFYGE